MRRHWNRSSRGDKPAAVNPLFAAPTTRERRWAYCPGSLAGTCEAAEIAVAHTNAIKNATIAHDISQAAGFRPRHGWPRSFPIAFSGHTGPPSIKSRSCCSLPRAGNRPPRYRSFRVTITACPGSWPLSYLALAAASTSPRYWSNRSAGSSRCV